MRLYYVQVWTQTTANSNFKMVKVHSVFHNVLPEIMFDVLHDPEYRKEWDEHMIASIEIGYLNPNNDVGYYSLACPTPVKNRDFVLQRSWLDLGNEKFILNHSVEHRNYPPRKGFVRGLSILTGFIIRPADSGCFLGYISQTDPRGKLPPWLVNKISQKFAPKVVKQLHTAAQGYQSWKASRPDPNQKPWIYPEQTLQSPRVHISEVSSRPLAFILLRMAKICCK
ncbi:phosphatidylcholine transfer protein [Holotrichia oblita]|uniref:Phosphatidylcholine transfer protein n=3 Tax=Holotrichia oblita TaxID=644536 RepID=A0ACB9T4J5_HOLOL|nr:phosphatidylcholine transfer protein [Holotrichia oblita]KAI4461664.1 phosphatidylcholine transfer protein [Holotrichia oblita]KAI4461680.1 phosphatidylcholine transfer protein [Holotrichia oblita]